MTLTKLFIILSNIPVLICFLYAIGSYKQLDATYRPFAWFIFFSGVVQLGSLGFWFFSINNMPFLHVYVALGFLLLSLFYDRVIGPYLGAFVIKTVAGLFLLFTTINSIYFESIFTFNATALTVESVLIIIYALGTFTLRQQVDLAGGIASAKGINWINSGLFLYYSCNLLLFYFSGIIMDTVEQPDLFNIVQARYSWMVHNSFTVILYTCFIVGLWKRLRHSTSSPR